MSIQLSNSSTVKMFMFNPKGRAHAYPLREDKERSSLSRILPFDLKKHQWAPHKQLWKIQHCAERSSENIWSIRAEAQNV